MKILGIGNAIVDVICKVEDDFITKNTLTKSTMKLIFDEKEFKELLSNLKIETPTLIVTEQSQSEVIQSSKNIKRVRTLPAKQLNALDLLNHDRLLITIDAIRTAEKLWSDMANTDADLKE